MANQPIITPSMPISIGAPVQGGTPGLYLYIAGDGTLGQQAVSAVPPDGSVTPPKISQTATNDFTFPRDILLGRNLIGSSQPTKFIPSVDSGTAFEFCNAAGVTLLTIDTSDGFIGINTSTPHRALYVIGDGQVTGNFLTNSLNLVEQLFLSIANDYAAIKTITPTNGTVMMSSDTHQMMVADGTQWNVVTMTPAP